MDLGYLKISIIICMSPPYPLRLIPLPFEGPWRPGVTHVSPQVKDGKKKKALKQNSLSLLPPHT
jgi:hypothetical protein